VKTEKRRTLIALAGGALVFQLPFARLASAADPIKIGVGMSLTGALAGGGRSALTTMRMWVNDVNGRGGLLGRKVELVNYDDQSNPASVPGIYVKLIDVDKVDLVVSGYGTNLQVPVMPMMMERKLLFMGSMGTGSNDKFKYDRFFQIFPAGPNARLAMSEGYFEAAAAMNPRPKTVALIGADAEFSQTALSGARDNAQKYGLKVVFDRSYPPNTVEFGPLLRGVNASKPELIYVGSYPPDTVAIIRAAGEMGLKAAMFGGALVGTQYAPIKTQLGPQLNGIVSFELYVPEPTMKFPGIEEFLRRYQEEAVKEKLDALGYYIPPFIYAEMQVLEQAIRAVGSLDQGKLADHIRKSQFNTVVGEIRFGALGEWAQPRILFVQFRNIAGNGLDQFRQPGRHVILSPGPLRSGELKYPYVTGG
jgi:branched-chain amino acid transport system substrate-binding protein